MLDDKSKRNPRGFDEPNDVAFIHGERFCGAVPEGSQNYPNHCLHGPSTGDQACCWCGDVFTGPNVDTDEHGNNFHPLTAREVEVVKLLAEGLSNQLISDALDITHHTTKWHITNIGVKLGKTTRAGIAAEVVRRGIV